MPSSENMRDAFTVLLDQAGNSFHVATNLNGLEWCFGPLEWSGLQTFLATVLCYEGQRLKSGSLFCALHKATDPLHRTFCKLFCNLVLKALQVIFTIWNLGRALRHRLKRNVFFSSAHIQGHVSLCTYQLRLCPQGRQTRTNTHTHKHALTHTHAQTHTRTCAWGGSFFKNHGCVRTPSKDKRFAGLGFSSLRMKSVQSVDKSTLREICKQLCDLAH